MLGILYAVAFAFTIVIEVSIIEKLKSKKWLWIIIYFLLYAIGIFLGGLLGNFAGEIYAKKHHIFDIGFGHLLGGVLYGITFVPFFILLFIYLYKKEKLNLVFTIIYILETLGIALGGFFLLLIG